MALAKVQPVPWLCGVSIQGAHNQPLACGVCSQSVLQGCAPGEGGASPPVMTTLRTPIASSPRARAGTVVAGPSWRAGSPRRRRASARLGVSTVARGSRWAR
jgi:hypothetical protein